MSAEKLNLVQWEARVGGLPPLVSLLSHDLYLDGRAPANAVAEAVRTLDQVGRSGRTQNGGRVPFRTQHACQDAVSLFEEMSRELAEAKDSMAKASTPEPWSKSRTSNWVARAGGLPDYIQHVSHGIKRSNPALSTGEAIQRAIGVVKNWARGGKNVDAGTRAAAAKAVAEWEAMKAKAHAKGAAKRATEGADASDEETLGKLLSAATRLAYVVKPLSNQATFAKRYGNRMAGFEGISRALNEGRPLAVATAEKMLDAPEGLPFEFLVEEFVERKQATLILMEALGYGSTPIRAKGGRKGAFHGMHGHERAVKKRKLIPGTVDHPAADSIAAGGSLSEAPSAATAVAFDPSKHPRAGGGEFGAKGGPPVGHAAPAQSDSAAQGSQVAAKIRANDPEFQKVQAELKQTAAFAAEHPAGAPMAPDQLQSLGYASDAHGIVQFQKDNGLPTTGKLDAATQQTIQNVYGSNRATAAGMPADLTGIKGAGAPASSPTGTGSAGGTGGRPGAAGRKTFGKTSAKKINEAVRQAVQEAIGDEPLMVQIAQPPPAGWHAQYPRGDRDDFDFDDETQEPPNLREGDAPTVCQTCAHFSPKGWITRRHVLGGCMKYSAQVDRTDLCDSYLTLSPPDATLRIHEAELWEAEESGDSQRILEARARVKAIRQRAQVQESIRREEAADEAFRVMESAAGVVEAVDLSKEGRRKLAGKGHALDDGSFPIPNVEFLKKAISAYGRAVAAGKGGKVKSYIVKRAKALGATNLLPDGWST